MRCQLMFVLCLALLCTCTRASTGSSRTLTQTGRANAAIVILTRESEMSQLLGTLKNFELRVNGRFGYPYHLLSEVEFGEHFKATVSAAVAGPIHFELIPDEHWTVPNNINMTRVHSSMEFLRAAKVRRSSRLGYRCALLGCGRLTVSTGSNRATGIFCISAGAMLRLHLDHDLHAHLAEQTCAAHWLRHAQGAFASSCAHTDPSAGRCVATLAASSTSIQLCCSTTITGASSLAYDTCATLWRIPSFICAIASASMGSPS